MAGLVETISPEHIGAAGHFVSALMQTLGIKAQGVVIAYMSNFIESVGALFYVVALCSALVSIALYGNYKTALYLAVSPAFFFFMLKTTQPSQGALIRFGDRTVSDSQKRQDSFVNLLTSADTIDGKSYDISWFYVQYDNLVTSVLQGVISLLLDTKNNKDLIAVGRERVFEKLFSYKSTDPGFVSLLTDGFLSQCSREAVGSASSGNKEDFETRAKNKKVALHNELIRYLEEKKVYNSETAKNGVSCYDVWGYVKTIAKSEADALKNGMKKSSNASQSGNIPWEEAISQVEKAVGGDSASASEIIVATLIKNTLAGAAHNAMTSRMFDNKPIDERQMKLGWGKGEADIANAEADGWFGKLVFFAAVIPYIQGFFLMILSMVFPFFCVFLIMPGKVSSFFVWMYLWLWVKSWDVGFAVLHFVREFLWLFMAKGAKEATSSIKAGDDTTIFQYIGANDPIATPNTYAALMAVLTLSIPALTAHLCMGASNLTKIFSLSIDAAANRFEQQRTTAARRVGSSEWERRRDRAAAQAKLAINEEVAKNPGYTINGVSRASAANGKAVKAAMGAYENLGTIQHHFSPEFREIAGALAAFSDRQNTASDSKASAGIAYLNHLWKEPNVVNPSGERNKDFGADTGELGDFTPIGSKAEPSEDGDG